MRTYLVFGDPRREENRRVLTADIPDHHIHWHGDVAEVLHNGHRIEGAVLVDPALDPNRTDRDPGAASLLVSQTLPSWDTVAVLHTVGWADYDGTPPAPQRLPFQVHTVVVETGTANQPDRVWTRDLWFDRPLVPTQRTVLRLDDDVTAPIRCLAMTPGDTAPPSAGQDRGTPGSLPYALLLVEPGADAMPWPDRGWTRMPGQVISDQWQDLIRVSTAVEVHVAYLLGATIVDSVTLHEPDLLTSTDLTDVLPADVALETTWALQDAGRDDLVPADTN